MLHSNARVSAQHELCENKRLFFGFIIIDFSKLDTNRLKFTWGEAYQSSTQVASRLGAHSPVSWSLNLIYAYSHGLAT